MNEYDFTDTEFDDDEGGESPAEGFNTLTDGTAVNQTMTQQGEAHVDPDPAPEPATYKDTTDAQKKKEMFLTSKGAPGSRSMREGKWDKYLINPKTGNSVFSEYEARQASRDGWAVPINAEGVRELAESIRNDVPEVGEELASLIMNSPQRARKAIANGKLTQSQAKRAYELMDKVYAYNKTRKWLGDAEDFSQTYPMRAEGPKTPMTEGTPKRVKEKVPVDDTGKDFFEGHEYPVNITLDGEKITNATRNKAIGLVNSTLGAALKMYDKRSISEDIGKWDDKTRRMITDAMRDLASRKSKSGKAAYIMANKLIKEMYSDARLKRFIRNNNKDYLDAAEALGKDRVREIARKVTVGQKGAWRVIDEFSGARPGASGHDSELREVLAEEVAKAKGLAPPKKRKVRTTPIVPSDKPKKKAEDVPAPRPKAIPKQTELVSFSSVPNFNMLNMKGTLKQIYQFADTNPGPMKDSWMWILGPLRGRNIPKELEFGNVVELLKKNNGDVDRTAEMLANIKV